MKTKKYFQGISICILCLFLFSCTEKPDPEEHFKKYILDPIPKSVKNIKVDQTMIYYGYAYLFGFDIDREDLNLIIDSKSLQTILNVEYTAHGSFYFEYNQEGWDCGVYGNKKQAKWFHPELWYNPDCYCYLTRINHQNDFRILLFNKVENKAYFYIEKSRD